MHARYLLGLIVIAGCGGGGDADCDQSGAACTWAGVRTQRGFNGEGLDRRDSWLGFVNDLTFGPDGHAWIADWNNHRIRRVEDDQTLTTQVGTGYEGDGSPGETDRLPLGAAEGALGTEVALNHPTDIEFLPDGTLVFAAWHNNKLRTLDPGTHVVKVLAGDGYGFAGDGGPAYGAVFNVPKAITIAPDGTIYVIDQRNQRVRRIAADADRTIETIAGDGTAGFGGDGGDPMTAEFHWRAGTTPIPSGGLALRGSQLYIADSVNHRIRVLDVDTHQLSTLAGTGTQGGAGDGGPASAAELDDPMDLELGPDGSLYVADGAQNVVRAIDLTTGTIRRVAGSGAPCPTEINCFEAEEGMTATDVQFAYPSGIAFDAAGNLYVADTNNSRIVRIAR